MIKMQNIFVIIGSAGKNSANKRLANHISSLGNDLLSFTIFNDLKMLSHFDPDLSITNPPREIIELRDNIERADGVIICTPEYVFSIPAGLKNALEWCVSVTVFANKPTGLITASADGKRGHEELKLIMKTVMARFTNGTTLLIPGIKSKIDINGFIANGKTKSDLDKFMKEFTILLKHH